MARCLLVQDGVVVNVIVADPETCDFGDGSLVIASDVGQTGDVWANGVLTLAPTVEPAPAVPDHVALWQAKAVLQKDGLLSRADAHIAAQNDVGLSAFWASGSTIRRDSRALAAIAAALGISDARVDELFVQAAAISL